MPSRGPHPPTLSGTTIASSTSIASGHSRAGDASVPVVHAATRKTAPWPAATTTEVTATTGHARGSSSAVADVGAHRADDPCPPGRAALRQGPQHERRRRARRRRRRARPSPSPARTGESRSEQRDQGQHHEDDLAGRPLPRDGAQAATEVPGVQAVPHAAVDVADDAAGQRAVEELRAVVRRDRRPQRQADAQATRDGLPPPGRADGGQRRDRRGGQQRPGADPAHAVEERTGAEPPDEDGEDRGTAERAGPRPGSVMRRATTRPAGRRLPASSTGGDGAAAVAVPAVQRYAAVVAGRRGAAAPAARRRAARRRAPRARASGSSGGHEPAREAGGGPPQRLGHPADGGRDDRQPDRQRLGDDHAVRLEA